MSRYSQEHLFDEDWVVDEIAAQPDAASAAAKTIELAMASVRADRKRQMRLVPGGRREREAP